MRLGGETKECYLVMHKAHSQNLANNWLPPALLSFVALSCLFCGFFYESGTDFEEMSCL